MNAATRKIFRIGYGLAFVALAANALIAYLDIRAIVQGNWWVEHTREVVGQLERTASTLKDAETGQRGYLLTGKDEYLKPYVDASNGFDREIDRLFTLTADNPEQQARLVELRRIAGEKLAELGQAVALMRKGDRDAALAVVQTDRGRALMDRARKLVVEMKAEEDRLLAMRSAASADAVWRAAASMILATAVVGSALMLVSRLRRREDAEKERAAEALRLNEEWLACMMDGIGDGIIATDGRGRVRLVNPVAQRLTGWTRAEAVGKPIEEVFHIVSEETRQPAENPVFRAIREGIVMGLANHTILIARDGRETAIDDSAAPIKDKDGQVVGVVMVFQDATERRRHETRLSESEVRFRQMAESIPQLAWIARPDGHIFWYNRRWYEYTGTTPEQMEGWGWQSVHDPEALPAVLERWGMSIATGEPFDMVFPLKAADGQFRPFLTRVMPLKDEAGRVVQWFGTNTDISEERRVEAALRESQDRYRTILESITDAFFALDRGWKFTYVNRKAEALLGRTRDDLLGKHIWEEYQPAIGTEFDRSYHRAMAEGVTVTFEEFYPPHDRWYEVHAYPSADGLAVYFRDINARKRADEEKARLVEASEQQRRIYETALSNSPDFNCVFDLEGRFTYLNSALLGLLRKSLDEAVGKDFLELDYPPDLAARLHRQIEQVIATKRPLRDETPFESHLGVRQYEYIFVPVLGAGGEVEAVTGSTRDVTERRRDEEALRAAKEEAEDANRAKDDFLAVLSHELRTPLNPILLATTAMLDQPARPEEIRPTLEMVRQNVTLQARLIDDLLDVMRIVRGKMPLHCGASDCHDLIRRAIEITRSDVQGKGHHLMLDLTAGESCVNADAARLQQVFWNLIKNAIKFTPEGGTIAVRTRDEADTLVVEFADTGIGIEPEVLPKIFDAFHQGDARITRRFGGLGLGLAICRGVVEAHGGTIAADSPGKDRGATFRVLLKTVPVPDDLPKWGTQDGDGTAEGTVPARAMNRLNILAVDDEATTLRLMARLLGGLGHRVVTAGTVADAWEEFQRSDGLDLIISDIGLPDGSGLDLMRKVKAVRSVPAIALTGYGMDEDIRRSRDAGFTTHMTKPIDFTKLEAMMRQITR